MSARENFHRMMTGDAPQWLPMFLNATEPVARRIQQRTRATDLVDLFKLDFRPIFAGGATDNRAWREALVQLGVQLGPDAVVGYCGITHHVPPRESLGDATHLRQLMHPLAEVERVEQIEHLPWPSVRPDDRAQLAAHVKQTHAEGRAAVAALECTLFETAWYLRGMDNLVFDLVEGGAVGNWLLDRLTQRSCEFAALAAELGFDVIGLGDDVGTQRGMMMAPSFWREHLRPRLKRVIDAIRAAQRGPLYIRYHSDGDIRPIVEDLIEIGVDVLNPMQPECMAVDEIIERFRGKIGFWGMIGTQQLMPFGTPAQIDAAV
ncbi:MAG TPA: uroporphyrinogen decarboxylase family protein, partial [Tepidisphaeraceae bacterium]|nr:uroporphyrinogen decarboxylase family protein [Tepidisphaeraceae bacterium]